MSDDDNHEEERIVIDYDAIDDATGFKAVELQAWTHYEENVLDKPEDERPDPDTWADEYSDEFHVDRKRAKYVCTMGIYAGPRDEFNQRSGSAKAIFANGDIYEGEYFEGKKHGQGRYVFKSLGHAETDVLLQKLHKAKPEGEDDDEFAERASDALKIGRHIVDNALEYGFFPCYHGDYHLGVRSGQGLMKNKDGSVYKGDWLSNKRHGQGVMYFINGDVYSGQWANGKKHGFGTYRYAKGGEYRGEWADGVFQEGQWLMTDGAYYEGRFDSKNRPMDGEATMHFPHRGMVMTGVFKKGKWAPQAKLSVSEETPADEEWVA